MNLTITYEWKGKRDALDVTEEGVYYVAFGADRLLAYNKTTSDKHFILIIHENTPFVVFDGVATQIDIAKGYHKDELKLDFTLISTMSTKVTGIFHSVRSRIDFSPKVLALGGLSLALIIFILFQFFGGKGDVNKADVVKLDANVAADEEGKLRELIEMRLKLAEKAMEQKRYDKALGILAKVVKIDPKNAPAIALQDKARKMMESHKGESQESLAEDLWIQQVLSEVSDMMSRKDYSGAQFKLQQILDKNPDHVPTLEMKNKIAAQLGEVAKTDQATEEEKARDLVLAEDKFKTGKRLMEESKIIESYRELNEAVELLNKYGMHPDFEIDLMDIYKVVKAQVQEKSNTLYSTATGLYQKGRTSNGVEASSSFFRKSLEELSSIHDILSEFDTSGLEEKIVMNLNERLKPLYEEALTLQELEGCCFAETKLNNIKRLAVSEKVDYYRLAEDAMSRCPCQR
ncbi:MAG: hypothetical protein ABIE74_04925 [Pseudomonadota bacterium]